MYISKQEKRAHRGLLKFMTALMVDRPHDRHLFEDKSDNEDLNGSCRVECRHRLMDGLSDRHQSEIFCVHTENGDGWQTAVAYNFKELPYAFVGIEPKEVTQAFRSMYAASSVMFCVSPRTGLVRTGTFFPSRFTLTEQIEATLSLQTAMPVDQFAHALWQTIVRHGGPRALQEIYEYHLDLIEYDLRLLFPLEEIRLLA
jgi:hypothetical protein